MKKLAIKIMFFAILFGSILCCENSFAYTGKINIDGINRLTDIFEYLNANNYHFSVSTRMGDVYLSKDESVIVTTGKGVNSLLFIDVLEPGHATNRGIEVGMTWNDVIKAYGSAYPAEGFWQKHGGEENCGMYYPVKNEYYSGYDIMNYESVVSSLLQGESADGIEFLINRSTKKIVLIHYYASMHRRIDLARWIQQYGLVPSLR